MIGPFVHDPLPTRVIFGAGMSADGIGEMVERTVDDPSRNPRPLDRDTLQALLTRAWSGEPPRSAWRRPHRAGEPPMNPQDSRSPTPSPSRGVEAVIVPRAHDIGGFEVRRALPARERQMIGPFIFFDQMGPGEFLTGKGLDVRPHPHIGLSTVTYLFDGEILHRDSLGSAQPIRPGDVNWMTAGRGIAHSERTDQVLRDHNNRLFGIQSWVALPKSAEETAPAFAHHATASLPLIEDAGVRLRLIAGTGWGLTAPATVASPLFYADATLAPEAVLELPKE